MRLKFLIVPIGCELCCLKATKMRLARSRTLPIE